MNEVGSLFWLTCIIWPVYFYWSRTWDYPADLEKHIRTGKVWPYLPLFWKKPKKKFIRTVSFSLFWLGNLFFAASIFYLFPNTHFIFLIIGFAIGFALSIFMAFKIRHLGTNEIIRLQQDRYFQIYTHLAGQALSKGDEISDSELLSRTQWQQHNDLRLADKQGRLLPFLRGEAKL